MGLRDELKIACTTAFGMNAHGMTEGGGGRGGRGEGTGRGGAH
jgi:hypothetical protein